MTIYIDQDHRCHALPASGLRAVETDCFDGKCDAFIEGYRYVPQGETWQRADGATFVGEMLSPATDPRILLAAQAEYEAALAVLNEIEGALNG